MGEQSATETASGEESLNKAQNQARKYFDRLNLRATFAGVFVAVGVILLAKLITTRISGAGLSGFVSQTTAAVFMGASTGHFFGMALRKKGDGMTSFLVGGAATLAIALLGVVGLSFTGGVLIAFTLGVFLMHNSGLVENHRKIEGYVEHVAEGGSGFALTLLALWEYAGPLIMSLLGGIGVPW